MIMKILFTDDSVLVIHVEAYEDLDRVIKLVLPNGRIRHIEKYEYTKSGIYHPGIKLYKDDKNMMQFVTQPKKKANIFHLFGGDKNEE